MDFKKKAGLALALAAIFTTGGANLALAADNKTFSGDGTVGAGDYNELQFAAATADNPEITVANGTSFEGGINSASSNQTKFTIKAASAADELTLVGSGGELAFIHGHQQTAGYYY